jgi:uncharacterized coiled-coil protein SlyX
MTSEELLKVVAGALVPLQTAVADMRDELRALDGKVERGFDRLDHRLALVESRMEDLGGHYAVQTRSIQRLEAEVTDIIRQIRPVKAQT